MELSYNSLEVLKTRYLCKDETGSVVETPEQLFDRISQYIAEGDLKYKKSRAEAKILRDQFYSMLTNLYFMPNTPTLINAGKENGQLSACFVIPIEDSMGEIFDALKFQALIHKSGGGTGFAFSRLRPVGDIVKSTMGVASGPVSFMEIFDKATDVVKQGGTRRGANMGILRVDHPDILDFVNCKQDLTRYTNFNISVAITDKFMDAVASGEMYDLVHPKTKEVLKQLDAREVFDLIIKNAWQTGEPGIIFVDKINADNPTPLLGEIESTNPCGEVPLLPYEACNLGSINLGKMIKTDSKGTISVDWPLLAEVTRLSTHFLDNVITQNCYPIPEIKQAVDQTRKVGLGVMGWADMLMALGISYCSEEALKLAGQVIEFIDYHSKVRSVELAEDRGAFPAFKGSVYDSGSWLYKKYSKRSAGIITDEMWKDLDQVISEKGIRNSTTTCIAPTGTISIIAGASGGIEPLFGLAFYRNIMGRSNMIELNPYFEKAVKAINIYSEDLLNRILENHGGVAGLDEVPDNLQKIFVTAHDVTPEWHIKMQAIFQLHTDNAVSKTCNFPEEATCDDIAKVYNFAYQNNLKGVTVYRNNSRSFQPMAHSKVGNETGSTEGSILDYVIIDSLTGSGPLTGITKAVSTPLGSVKVSVNYSENNLCDVHIYSDSYGTDVGALLEGFGRVITIALRKGASINEIVVLLKDIKSSSVIQRDTSVIYSTVDAIAKTIEEILNYNSIVQENIPDEDLHQKFTRSIAKIKSLGHDDTACPDCGETLIFGEGCFTCMSCGYSKCQV